MKMEAQRGKVTCLRSHSQQVEELGFEPKQTGSRITAFICFLRPPPTTNSESVNPNSQPQVYKR